MSSWFACHKHQLFDCDWRRWDLGMVLPGKPQGTETLLYTSHFLCGSQDSWGDSLLRWTVVRCWHWRWYTRFHIDCVFCKAVAATTLFFFCSRLHTMHTPVSVWDTIQLFCFLCVPLSFRLWRAFRKIMSLSKKQASCHATKEPSSEKSCDATTHTDSFLSNILLGGAMQQWNSRLT